MAMDGRILERFQDLIERTFNYTSLEQCLKYKLNVTLERIKADNLRNTIFAVLTSADRERWLAKLLEALASCNTAVPKDDAYEELAAALREAPVPSREAVPAASPGTAHTDILIDTSHNQQTWPLFSRTLSRIQPSLFDLADRNAHHDVLGDLAAEIAPETIIRITESLTDDLPSASGVVFALPHGRSRTWSFIADDTIDTIERWVHGGGRLLLLGFELADPHHRTNLGALSGRFGIELEMDLIADAGDERTDRPYDRPVAFGSECMGDHPLVHGVDRLELVNACSVRGLGGSAVVRVGPNPLAKPLDPRFDGLWFMRPDVEYAREASPDAAAVLQASRDRTRLGEVVAIGTWDLFGCRDGRYFRDFRNNPGNRRFCANLVSWLGRQGTVIKEPARGTRAAPPP